MSSTALAYGCMGFALAAFSNGVRKLPVMRRPWEHVMYFGIGTWLGSKVDSFKTNNKALLAEQMAKREAVAAERESRIAARKSTAH
ncbi:hypothetical protein BWQ96_03218 [Gracilariopsis chorda]|uniref:Uncharacterized protein n=1 Tax=Gracilariopsis chorda TaxID=448386 RepID=A0A2V3IY02_9FLOR|nr:hypothetical protein BWQ96_03218 [Gracilariopsis chorda]|eukprot:PXF47028.1 hypothetical protein BWQ96_03218 [Gracilariopsis chorda]